MGLGTRLISNIATLSVDVTGDGLCYPERKKDGISLIDRAGKLEGLNIPMLRVLDVQIRDEGFYSCMVTMELEIVKRQTKLFL